MLDGKRPEKPKRRVASIAAIALLSGGVAGALAVYVGGTGSGKASAANCPAAPGFADAVNAAARGEVAAVHALDEPFDARAIAFKDADGLPKSLGDYSGKAMLVNLWATWCVPCRAEMPALDALERQKGGADFAVVPINVDLGDGDKPKAFYTETNLTALPLYRDETMGVFTDLKTKGITIGLPVSLLVDAEGCARAAITGPAEWASPDGIAMVDVLRKGGA